MEIMRINRKVLLAVILAIAALVMYASIFVKFS